MTKFLVPFLAGQFRHVLTAASGYLVAKGVIPTDQNTAFVEIGVALAMYGIGAVWSGVQKYRSVK